MWCDGVETRSHGRLVRDLAKSAIALPWTFGFWVMGRLLPRRPASWFSPGGLRVLVVAPHPDDEVAGCAGTLLLHRARGDAVTVVHVTDGRQSRALGLDREEMVRRRRQEAERAAEMLNVDLVWMGLPEGSWWEGEAVSPLVGVISSVAPDVIYAPSRVDFHPEHRRVAAALARALEGGLAGAVVRIYEVQVPLTSRLVNQVADISAVASRCRQAMEAYRTQLGSLRRTLRGKRYTGLRYRAGSVSESFWEVSAAEYSALHPPNLQPPRSVFRGLRALPFSDPLAYLRGREERSRLSVAARTTGILSGGGA